MEKSEALLILGISDAEDVENAYEEKVFEWKNFFVNRFPVAKLFHAKLHQLDKLEAAYEILGGQKHQSKMAESEEHPFDRDFMAAFRAYSNQRSQLKMQLFAATNALQVKEVVLKLIALTRDYAQVWYDSALETKGAVVSKEPDPMDILKALEEAKQLGVHNISEISRLPEGHLVLNEAKRLSLWTKMAKQ